jgi:hypothetical protein
VQGYPGLDSRQQVSTDGGSEPAWSRSGKELFFRRGRRLMAVDVKTGPALEFSRPRLVFEGDFDEGGTGGGRNYDVAANGRRFVMTRARSQVGAGEVNVALNWLGELRRRDGGGKP